MGRQGVFTCRCCLFFGGYGETGGGLGVGPVRAKFHGATGLG